MDLVERMMFANRQTMTSKELAKAISMSHSKLRQFVAENHIKIAPQATLQTNDGCFIFTIEQAFSVIVCIRLYKQKATLAMHLKRKAFRDSLFVIIRTRIIAERHRRDVPISPREVILAPVYTYSYPANYIVRKGEE